METISRSGLTLPQALLLRADQVIPSRHSVPYSGDSSPDDDTRGATITYHRATSLGRREFLRGVTGAGAATVLGAQRAPVAAEPPPETNKIRLPQTPAMCEAPQVLVGDLLKAEGFTAESKPRNCARNVSQLEVG